MIRSVYIAKTELSSASGMWCRVTVDSRTDGGGGQAHPPEKRLPAWCFFYKTAHGEFPLPFLH
jgi:hypothetical protein